MRKVCVQDIENISSCSFCVYPVVPIKLGKVIKYEAKQIMSIIYLETLNIEWGQFDRRVKCLWCSFLSPLWWVEKSCSDVFFLSSILCCDFSAAPAELEEALSKANTSGEFPWYQWWRHFSRTCPVPNCNYAVVIHALFCVHISWCQLIPRVPLRRGL